MDDFSMSDLSTMTSTENIDHHPKLKKEKSEKTMSLNYFGPRPDREEYGVTPESFMEMDMNALLIEDKIATYLFVATDNNIESVEKDAVLVVDCSLKHQVGDIVVVAIDGEVILRRFVKLFHPGKHQALPALITDKEGEEPIFLHPEFTEVFFKGVVRSIIIFCRPCP